MTLKSEANLKKNWLVVWKMTWEIWQIFTRALESFKIGILMGSFCPKQKKYELKIYREVICCDNEEWCKIWRRIDMWFQNWYAEFDKLWPEHSKISKMCTLVHSSTYQLFFMTLEMNDAKLNKNWLLDWKMTQGIWQIFTRTLESLKFGTLMGSFYPK